MEWEEQERRDGPRGGERLLYCDMRVRRRLRQPPRAREPPYRTPSLGSSQSTTLYIGKKRGIYRDKEEIRDAEIT